MTFGLFPNTGAAAAQRAACWRSISTSGGYRPGWFWAPAISVTELVGGPMLALGLFTRPAALPLVLFLMVANVERWRVGSYFWNKLGLEYTLMWLIAAFYFLIHGGGTLFARPSHRLGVLTAAEPLSRALSSTPMA